MTTLHPTTRRVAALLGVLLLGVISAAWSQDAPAPAAEMRVEKDPPPRSVVAEDDPEEKAGSGLTVKWQAPKPEELLPGVELVGYQILVAEDGEKFEPGAQVSPKDTEQAAEDEAAGKAEDQAPDLSNAWYKAAISELKPSNSYRVKVAALYAPPGADWYAPGSEPPEGAEKPVEATAAESPETAPVSPIGLWYDPSKTNVLTGMLLYTIIVVLCFSYARRGDMYIRPIAGLKAVDDAIGRATEMGKPMLFVQGLNGIADISTIASMFVLGHLARKTAPYETPILVPCFDPLVMAADREIVREAYLEAGRPQAYRPENIFFVTDSQFGYVAAVDGLMMREKPAANFFMGYFYAESLILAETGYASGAIQIAGTDADTQIPFFITACDYTLMGEELYAASAYLSRHPKLLAQLKGQDIGKAIMTLLLIVTTLLVTMKAFGHDALAEWVTKLFGA